MPDLELPDGRIIQDIPEGLSKDQITSKLIGAGILTGNEEWLGNQAQSQPKQENFQDSNRRRAGEFLKGIPQGLGNAAIGGIQAATDLGEAAAQGIEKAVYGDVMPQQTFGNRLANQIKKLDQKQSKLPISEKIGIGAGEIAPYLGVGAGMGVIKGGAAAGGVSSLLSTQDESGLENRLKEGAIGTAEGAAVGSVVKGIGAAFPSISSMIKKLIPDKTPEGTLSKVIKPEKAAALANRLEASGERQTLLPDIAGDEVAGLTRLLGKTSGSKNIINTALNNRTATSAKRVGNLINNNFSAEKYFGSLNDLIKARAEISAPLYQKAYTEGSDLLAAKGDVIRKAGLNELIKDERIGDAIKKARKDFGISNDVSDVSVEALHGARQQVDDIISGAYRAGENNKARSYLQLKDKINKVLYESSPTLKQADQTFAGFSALKNAQETGLEFNKIRPEELKTLYSGLTHGEKDAFKIGVRESLMKSIQRTPEGASVANKIFAKPENRQQLRIIFDNPAEFGDFSRKMIDEMKIFNTKNRILGGSRTDINLADEKEIINKGIQLAKSPKLGAINAITDSIQKAYLGISDKNAANIARIITNKQKSIDALRNIANKTKGKEKEAVNNLVKDQIEYLMTIGATKSLNDKSDITNLKEE